MQNPEQPDEPVRRDRRVHGGSPVHVDDDALARRTEAERVDAGIDDYDPDDVPPATDVEPTPDVTQSEEYEDERAEVGKEVGEGELRQGGEQEPFPPTRYDNS